MNKKLFPILIGNFFEIYDFSLYGLFSILFADLFFKNYKNNLIISFFIFFAGFFARPIGSVVFGYIGDTCGRKKSLLISTSLMATSSLIIGILPSESTSPIFQFFVCLILVSARLMQGFSMGGETGGAIVLLHELTVKNQTLYMSYLYISGGLGSLFAIFTTYVSLKYFSASNAWRIAYLVNVIFIVVIFYIRTHVIESPVFLGRQSVKKPFKILKQFPTILYTLVLGGFMGAVSCNLFVYINIYLILMKNYEYKLSILYTAIAILIYIIFVYVFAKINKYVESCKILMSSTIFTLLSSYIAYFFLYNSYPIVSFFLFGISAASFNPIFNGYIYKCFPIDWKYTSMAFSCGVGISIFGGTVPIINSYLIQVTNNELAPAFYLMFLSTITTYCIKKLR